MRNIIKIACAAIIASCVSTASTFAADYAIGISVSQATIDTSGTQTLKDTGGKTSLTKSEDATLPEIFGEIIGDNGLVLGLTFIPAQDLGSGSRDEAVVAPDKADDDSGTNKAEAETMKIN